MKRSTTILAVLFILLLAIFYLETLKEKKGDRELSSVIEVEKDRIAEIEITRNKEKIILAKQEGEWQISEPIKYRANQAYVEDLLDNILSLEIEALASESPEKQTFYEVDTAGGITVKASADDRPLSSFIIGKQGYPHTYLRPVDSNKIYRVKGVSRWHYTRGIKDWRDKTIFDFEATSVKEITLSETEAVTILRREGDLWKMESKGEESPADTEAVNQLLSTASTLKANDVKDTAPERDFSRPDFRVAITFDSGETRGLSLLAEDEPKTRYLARKDGDETIFVLYKGNLAAIIKSAEELKVKE